MATFAQGKWLEIVPGNSPTNASTFLVFRWTIKHFGTPETIVLDNGSRLTSSASAELCRKYGAVHVRSSQHHPQSNAQRFVDTLKHALHEPKERGPTEEILQRFLLAY
ncbi:hypothetical protein CLF_108968 [Clonorchis sinensis]|uniref:Integrase catalytic domain-containing protein n=1 Tax=Clonorchis sinensis TaxID=79923 RepID=G7YIS2_CLOSI|nr:hypothetical protein CLF_108968 [Clonorchis sinensis]